MVNRSLLDHPLVVGIMQWNGVLFDLRNPNDLMKPWKSGFYDDISFMDDVQSARYEIFQQVIKFEEEWYFWTRATMSD